MPDIIAQYEKERDWIKERISEKTEKQADDSLELDNKVPDLIKVKEMEEEAEGEKE